MQLTKSILKRRADLGIYGEKEATDLLKKAGFINIVNLNNIKRNHKFADFIAERGGTRFVINVKARNKWERTSLQYPKPHINARFKLGDAKTCLQDAKEAEEKYSATASWLVLAFEENTYDAYFGTMEQLRQLGLNGKAVVMTSEYTHKYECLARAKTHPYDFATFWNEAPSANYI